MIFLDTEQEIIHIITKSDQIERFLSFYVKIIYAFN